MFSSQPQVYVTCEYVCLRLIARRKVNFKPFLKNPGGSEDAWNQNSNSQLHRARVVGGQFKLGGPSSRAGYQYDRCCWPASRRLGWSLASFVASHETATQEQASIWLPFELSLHEVQGQLRAEVINGTERIPVTARLNAQGGLSLDMPHYASRIVLRPASLSQRGTAELSGVWTKRRGGGAEANVRCRAARSQPHSSEQVTPVDATDRSAYMGRWSVRFDDSDDPAVAVFQALGDGDGVQGTFMTTTGDYRFLAGRVTTEGLELSCFDGAHAFLFRARLTADQSTTEASSNESSQTRRLQGDFWSGNWYHTRWSAVADPAAELPDGFEQTTAVDDVSLEELRFPDLGGELQPVWSPDEAGRITLIEVFGSWCPNCHDEASYLGELQEKYGDELNIVGLAFELTGEFERDAAQVRRYVERFEIRYPVLVAGLSDKARATEQFPVLDRVRSFPTTLFVDRTGDIRAIYTGFSGPATGPAHTRLRSQFEALIDRLLAE